jgi:superfamily II DNA or RNA helicase
MILRDYQQGIVVEFNEAIKSHRCIVVACPTGSGKTVLAVEGLLPMLPHPVAWITHRVELADQIAAHGCGVDVVMAQSRAEIACYGSIIIDEGHHAAAMTYRRIMEANATAKVVCLTATPYRMDGIGLGHCGFTKLIVGPDTYALTQAGWLARASVFVPKSERSGAWYARDAVEALCARQFSRALVYVSSVGEGMEFVRRLEARGLRAHCVTAATPKTERSEVVNKFKRGHIQVLCNHSIFTEGNDIPAVDAIVLNRFTQSRCLWKQMMGRGLRKQPGKNTCLVLDLAGNGILHGSIYDQEIFTLEGSVDRIVSRTYPGGDYLEPRKELQLKTGEELKIWAPPPKPTRIIASLQKLKSTSLLRRFVTA